MTDKVAVVSVDVAAGLSAQELEFLHQEALRALGREGVTEVTWKAAWTRVGDLLERRYTGTAG